MNRAIATAWLLLAGLSLSVIADCEPDPAHEDHIRADRIDEIDPNTHPALMAYRNRVLNRAEPRRREWAVALATELTDTYRGLVISQLDGTTTNKRYFIHQTNPTYSRVGTTGLTLRVWIKEDCCRSGMGAPQLLGFTHFIDRVMTDTESPPQPLTEQDYMNINAARITLAQHWSMIHPEPLQFTNAPGSPEDLQFMADRLRELSGNFFKPE